MKPCSICGEPKTWHDDFWNIKDHKFQLDNLKYLEKKYSNKKKKEEQKKRNTCQICGNYRKSPFGICKECSEILVNRHRQEELKKMEKNMKERFVQLI